MNRIESKGLIVVGFINQENNFDNNFKFTCFYLIFSFQVTWKTNIGFENFFFLRHLHC